VNIKNKIFVPALFFILIMGCNNTQKNSDVEGRGMTDRNAPNSSNVIITGKEWKLIEVRINNISTGFNRDSLIREGFDHFFTVNLDGDTISGTGAPNLYSAPYTLGDNQSINIKTMISTLMASLFEPENLTEHDFFTFMQNAYECTPVNNNLEFRSKTADGSEARLVFSP